ncbi:MAG: hypothetical protein HY548_07915 [Elusimicrobia bacterium]|nr:hypothetical protein [Elusimicrobiota bacterium]
MKTTKIAVVQTSPVLGQKDKNLARALSLMQEEAADVYVLPELAMEGYNFTSREQVNALAELSGRGPAYEALQAFAQSRKAYVAYGFLERAKEGFYNASALLGPAGLISVYRKTHLFDREKLFFLPGDSGFQIYHLPFGVVGMMICFDWYFPEAMRTLALKGAQLVLHPSNLVLPHCPDAMLTRCLENRVFAATANRVGTEEGGEGPLTFIGRSEVVSPRGEILARLGPAQEGVCAAECDLSSALRKDVTSRNDVFKDRRTEFYLT